MAITVIKIMFPGYQAVINFCKNVTTFTNLLSGKQNVNI